MFLCLFFSYCDGRVLITDCSGLAIISVYPIVESEFHMYTWRGTIWDGEGLAGRHRYLNFILELYMFFLIFSKIFTHFLQEKESDEFKLNIQQILQLVSHPI